MLSGSNTQHSQAYATLKHGCTNNHPHPSFQQKVSCGIVHKPRKRARNT